MSDKIVKNLNFGEDARVNVFKGIQKLTNAVSSTLGASGKCVILEDGGGNPVITKDGVTVAETITLLDPVENMGATLLKEAAKKTVKEAGDGTTTATVLAHAILEQAYSIEDKNLSSLSTSAFNRTLQDLLRLFIKDTLLELNSGASSNSNDSGIIIQRGSTGNDALFIWDESNAFSQNLIL